MVLQAGLHRSSESTVNIFEGVPAMTVERTPVEVLKVSATSKPVAVAGAIPGVIRSEGRGEVQAIGAGAINQAGKAIAISRGYLAPRRVEPLVPSRRLPPSLHRARKA